MDNWMDGEVENQKSSLTGGQVDALLRMTEALKDYTVAYSVGIIKNIISGNIKDVGWSEAKECWDELSEDEQIALWVAPKFGGIFTTEERKIIKGGFNE